MWIATRNVWFIQNAGVSHLEPSDFVQSQFKVKLFAKFKVLLRQMTCKLSAAI